MDLSGWDDTHSDDVITVTQGYLSFEPESNLPSDDPSWQEERRVPMTPFKWNPFKWNTGDDDRRPSSNFTHMFKRASSL